MVLEVSSTQGAAAFGAKANANAKCFDYSKSGARPKTQDCWIDKKASQQPTKSSHGAWGPMFKNKQNFIDMHMFWSIPTKYDIDLMDDSNVGESVIEYFLPYGTRFFVNIFWKKKTWLIETQ